MSRSFTALIVLLLLAPLTSACGDEAMWRALGESLAQAAVEETIEETVEEAAPQLELGDVVLAGVTPADDYRQTGRVELSLLSGAAAISQGAMRVQVEGDDGGYRDCDYRGGVRHRAAAHNVVTVLLDGSGSMELSYPPEEFDDTCLTCPHDPDGARLGATRSFIDTVFAEAPGTRLALGEFGPEPTHGFFATRLHQDFASTGDDAYHGLDHAVGYERLGTPLYDAAGEMLVAMDEEAYLVEREVGGEARRIMVVLSDGRDTLSERWDLGEVIDEARATRTAIYAVGLGPASARFDAGYDFEEQRRSVLDLQQMAAATGGFYAAADDPRALHELFDALAAALTAGYADEGYRCVPEGAAPTRGQLVRGRVLLAGQQLPWAFVAP